MLKHSIHILEFTLVALAIEARTKHSVLESSNAERVNEEKGGWSAQRQAAGKIPLFVHVSRI